MVAGSLPQSCRNLRIDTRLPTAPMARAEDQHPGGEPDGADIARELAEDRGYVLDNVSDVSSPGLQDNPGDHRTRRAENHSLQLPEAAG